MDELDVRPKKTSKMKRQSQRAMMRELYREFPSDSRKVIALYAAEEVKGNVCRKSNLRDLSPQDFAARLYADGQRKGWINE